MRKNEVLIAGLIFISLNFSLLVEAQEASDPVVVNRASGKIIIDGNLDE